MLETIIIDTSSLIALEKLSLLSLLGKMYSQVILPEAVLKEFGDVALSCVKIKKVESTLVRFLTTGLNLGKGEKVKKDKLPM